MIPEAAVEAAAEIAFNRHGAKYYSQMGPWADLEPRFRTAWIEDAKQILEAAAPHMLAPGTPERGEGDYLPGWDDRKTLARLWQERAMLPVDGLSERVYEALIAVATWGYEQRKAEDL